MNDTVAFLVKEREVTWGSWEDESFRELQRAAIDDIEKLILNFNFSRNFVTSEWTRTPTSPPSWKPCKFPTFPKLPIRATRTRTPTFSSSCQPYNFPKVLADLRTALSKTFTATSQLRNEHAQACDNLLSYPKWDSEVSYNSSHSALCFRSISSQSYWWHR